MAAPAYDCLIIGAGPAGLTAASYLGRFLRRVLVLHTGESRAGLIPTSHNCPGFPEGIGGNALLSRLHRQAEQHGATIVKSRVTHLARLTCGFRAEHDDGRSEAGAVILATGIRDHMPPLERLHESIRDGRVRFCPICDGYEAMDKRIAVLGPSDAAIDKARFLRTYSREVAVIDADGHRERTCDDGAVQIWRGDVEDMTAGDIVVRLSSSEQKSCDVLYPALGCTPNSRLATDMGAAVDDNGALITDKDQQTSVPGLYAAGDVVSELDQLAVAFGHAAIAASHIHNALPRNVR